MVAYRRNKTPGARYFFTVTLLDRSSRLLVERIADLRVAFRAVRAQRPFTLDAVVVLPDHLHCIWTLPPDDGDYSLRWRGIKSRFSRRVPPTERRTRGRVNKMERGIWQRRFWEHTLRDGRDVKRHIDYLHYNPVKHGFVSRVRDWPYSSFHRGVRKGMYPWIGRKENVAWQGASMNEVGVVAWHPGFREKRSTQATRSIELNPVRAMRVTNPGEYRWSSYACNAMGKTEALVQPHALYSTLGQDRTACQHAYRALFRAHLAPAQRHAIRDAINQEWVLGRDDFKEKIERMTQRQTKPGHAGRPRASEEGARYYI